MQPVDALLPPVGGRRQPRRRVGCTIGHDVEHDLASITVGRAPTLRRRGSGACLAIAWRVIGSRAASALALCGPCSLRSSRICCLVGSASAASAAAGDAGRATSRRRAPARTRARRACSATWPLAQRALDDRELRAAPDRAQVELDDRRRLRWSMPTGTPAGVRRRPPRPRTVPCCRRHRRRRRGSFGAGSSVSSTGPTTRPSTPDR